MTRRSKEIEVEKEHVAVELVPERGNVSAPSSPMMPMTTAEEDAHKEEVGNKEKPEKAAKFPIKGFVNQWGFIHLKAEVQSAFGAAKGEKTPITIDFKNEALIIRVAYSSIGPSVGR